MISPLLRREKPSPVAAGPGRDRLFGLKGHASGLLRTLDAGGGKKEPICLFPVAPKSVRVLRVLF